MEGKLCGGLKGGVVLNGRQVLSSSIHVRTPGLMVLAGGLQLGAWMEDAWVL